MDAGAVKRIKATSPQKELGDKGENEISGEHLQCRKM